MNRYASARLHLCKNFDNWSRIKLQLWLWRAPTSHNFCTLGDKWVKKWGPRDGGQAVQTEPAPRGRQACRANGCHTPRTPMNLLSDFRTPRAGEAPQPSFISFNIRLIPVAVLPDSPHPKNPLFPPPVISVAKVITAHLPGIRAGYRLETCRFLFRWKDMVTRGDESAKISANGLERRSSWLI